MKKLISIVVIISIILLLIGCDSNKNDNMIKIISIEPTEGITVGVPQLFTIEIEYILSTDELGYIWIGFNSEYNRIDPNPRLFPAAESYKINKGSGNITFTGTVTPIDWSAYNSSFYVIATISAYNNGKLGDMVNDQKKIY